MFVIAPWIERICCALRIVVAVKLEASSWPWIRDLERLKSPSPTIKVLVPTLPSELHRMGVSTDELDEREDEDESIIA